MAGHCEIFEHTADIGLKAHADTLEELFAALAEGLADLICSRQQVEEAQSRNCEVTAEDIEALLVDFLWQVMSTIQFEHFMVSAVHIEKGDKTSVKAVLAGEPYDPKKHELATEIKAVTYHNLKVAQEDGRWTAQVILDI